MITYGPTPKKAKKDQKRTKEEDKIWQDGLFVIIILTIFTGRVKGEEG